LGRAAHGGVVQPRWRGVGAHTATGSFPPALLRGPFLCVRASTVPPGRTRSWLVWLKTTLSFASLRGCCTAPPMVPLPMLLMEEAWARPLGAYIASRCAG
jgi:hypothetical protein